MTWFLESPWPALLIGGLATAILASGWLHTGRQALLYLMLVCILLTVGAVVLERAIVTDREQVDATLHEIARLVEKNDVPAVLRHAYSGSPAVRAQAAAELPRYKFQTVTIARNLEIKMFPKHLPPKATAEFNVIVRAGLADGSWGDQSGVRFVEVTLFQEPTGEWRVASYEHADPLRGAREDDRQPFRPPSAR
jgi:hypothetical protein